MRKNNEIRDLIIKWVNEEKKKSERKRVYDKKECNRLERRR